MANDNEINRNGNLENGRLSRDALYTWTNVIALNDKRKKYKICILSTFADIEKNSKNKC